VVVVALAMGAPEGGPETIWFESRGTEPALQPYSIVDISLPF